MPNTNVEIDIDQNYEMVPQLLLDLNNVEYNIRLSG